MQDILFDHLLVSVEDHHILHFILLLILKHLTMSLHKTLLHGHELPLQHRILQCANNRIEVKILLSTVTI